MSPDVLAFLSELKPARKEKRMTMQMVADRAGTCKSHIHQLENGQVEPRLGVVLKLAALLEIRLGI